ERIVDTRRSWIRCCSTVLLSITLFPTVANPSMVFRQLSAVFLHSEFRTFCHRTHQTASTVLRPCSRSVDTIRHSFMERRTDLWDLRRSRTLPASTTITE